MTPSKAFRSTAWTLVMAAMGTLSCVAQSAAEGPVVADSRAPTFVTTPAAETVTVSPIAVAVALQARPQVVEAPTRPAATLEPTASECSSGSILHAGVDRRDSVQLRAPDSMRDLVAPDCPSASLSLEADPDPGGDAYPGPKTMFVWLLGFDW